jgi:hypothetical protein
VDRGSLRYPGSGGADGDTGKSRGGQTESHDQEADGIFQSSNSFEELSVLNLNEGRG